MASIVPLLKKKHNTCPPKPRRDCSSSCQKWKSFWHLESFCIWSLCNLHHVKGAMIKPLSFYITKINQEHFTACIM